MFCASCGVENPDNAKFCSGCGKNPSGSDTNVDVGATATAFASQMRGSVEKQGLMFIAAIAYYIGFWSILMLLIGGFGLVAAQGMGPMMGKLGMGMSAGDSVMVGFIMMAFHLLGVFGLTSAYGLFKKQEWARKSTIVISIIWVVIYIFSLFSKNQISGPTLLLALLGASLYVGIVLYLKMPAIKEYFSQE